MCRINQIIRAHRRTLSIEINKDAELIVRAPLRMDRADIERFVNSKAHWIAVHQKRVEEEKERFVPFSLTEGATVPLAGQVCTLHFSAEPSFSLDRGRNILWVPRDAAVPDFLEWLGGCLRRCLEERIPHYAARMGQPVPRFRLANGRSRWGYCNYKNELGFNWHLAFCPAEVVDYVVVHELCHLTNKSHDCRFWQAVESILPDRRDREQWLKINRRVMDIL